ncbi:hypothetical protein NON00_18510 [Roseomonas sp. GC11]|uniref:hypothetical protein n=1 Tax=Roseomonas sp. GC11 TaxID=2950546 RepID=UPI002109D4FD|nr:hypothetical protein [Roseomonas sp. GC11]MCQ4161911.1 hypothetical protein [Roseomonas sp. GC11]
MPLQRDQRPRLVDWLKLALAALATLAMVLLVAVLAERETEPPVVVAHRRFLLSLTSEEAGPGPLAEPARFGLVLERSEAVAGGLYGGYHAGGSGCRLGFWRGPRKAAPRRAPPGWQVALVPRGGEMLWLVAGADLSPRQLALLATALEHDTPLAEPLCHP